MNPAIEPAVAELEGLTVGAALRRSAQRYPENIYWKGEGPRTSFRAFDEAVDRLACGFLSLGIQRGDHIALWLPNSREWALCFYAAARLGAVVVPINTRYTEPEAAYILRQSDARLLVLMPRLWGRDYSAMLERMRAGAPELRHVVWAKEAPAGSALTLEGLLAGDVDRAALGAAEAGVTPRDRLLICYTSGTTGKPKGAMHDHRVIKQSTRVGLSLCLAPGGAILGHMPLYHVAGLYMALIPAMTLGAGFINMQQWDAGKALELLEREEATCLGGIPTHFVDLVNDPTLSSRNLDRLKAAWIGGSPVMQATYDRFESALGLKHLLSTYGMTENTISTSFNRLEDPRSACSENRAPILCSAEVRVVDPPSGRTLSTGEVGEVWCRGETVMMGYYKDPEATRATITEEGWLRTGDLGRFDDQGFLAITGRLKEMFKSGGTNVYPAEIEQHLSRHPAVRMAAVIGVADERLSEVGFAYVEVNEGRRFTLEDLRAHCKGVLADYKIPKHLAVVPALPRTSTGKIQKSELQSLCRSSPP